MRSGKSALLNRPSLQELEEVTARGKDAGRGFGDDPQAWLTDVLGCIADHKITKLDELMPWRYAQT